MDAAACPTGALPGAAIAARGAGAGRRRSGSFCWPLLVVRRVLLAFGLQRPLTSCRRFRCWRYSLPHTSRTACRGAGSPRPCRDMPSGSAIAWPSGWARSRCARASLAGGAVSAGLWSAAEAAMATLPVAVATVVVRQASRRGPHGDQTEAACARWCSCCCWLACTACCRVITISPLGVRAASLKKDPPGLGGRVFSSRGELGGFSILGDGGGGLGAGGGPRNQSVCAGGQGLPFFGWGTLPPNCGNVERRGYWGP